MEKDLITIIIPVFKAEKYIDRCLKSVLCQTYKNFEAILVDDGSPDDCPKMCDEYAKQDKRIKVIHKKNGGVSSARNEGLKLATGKYVCFVDVDDEIKPNYLEVLHNNMLKEKTDLVICSSLSEKPDGSFFIEGLTDSKKIDFNENLEDILSVYDSGIFMPPYCKLYKKDKIKEFFPEFTNYGEDEIFNLQYFNNIKSVAVISDSLYIYHFNNGSLSRQKSDLLAKRLDNMQIRHKLLLSLFGNNSDIANYLASKFVIRHIFWVVTQMIADKLKTKEIVKKLEELVLKEQIKFALNIYVPMDKRTTLIWKCLVKKQFRKLIFIGKIKKLLSK